jgi:glycosyltransferase involved in cell wall biosynthesis
MHIVSLMFPTNFPNFAADSIWVFNRVLFTSMMRGRRSIRVSTIGPPQMAPLSADIPHYPVDFGSSKLQVRFGFPWDAVSRLIHDLKPDVCFVNMPEQATNIVMLVRDELGLDTHVVNYIHYLPAFIDETGDAEIQYEPNMNRHGHCALILMRILDGVMASDTSIICSEFGAALLRRLACAILHDLSAFPPVRVLPPPIGVDELAIACGTAQPVPPRLVYNHRLYSEYGTEEIFSLLEEVHREKPATFKVLVTNPTHGRSACRARLNPQPEQTLDQLSKLPFVQVVHFKERGRYYSALRGCAAGIAPLKPHALWSMSVVDVLASNRPVIAFDVGAFAEIGVSGRWLVRNGEEFKRAVHRVVATPASEQPDDYRAIVAGYSGDHASRRLLGILQEAA